MLCRGSGKTRDGRNEFACVAVIDLQNGCATLCVDAGSRPRKAGDLGDCLVCVTDYDEVAVVRFLECKARTFAPTEAGN
jgi:hypothetical protein